MNSSLLKISIFLLLCTLISGCATYVDYYSNPPGAYITYKTVAGETLTNPTPKRLEYPGWTSEYRNGGCMIKTTPSVRWPDGVSLDPTSIRLCRNEKGHVFNYTFQKPQQPPAPVQNYSPPVEAKKKQYSESQDRTQSTPTKAAPSLPTDAEKKCQRLGLMPGSDDYSLCIKSPGK